MLCHVRLADGAAQNPEFDLRGKQAGALMELAKKIYEENNKDKRVFLFEHVFYGQVGNVNGLYPYGDLPSSGPAGEFKALMKKYKNVISFTGHSHLHFDLQRANEFANVAIKDGEYGYRVHCPSASKPRKNDK